jgi:hypothetical protein
MADRAFGTNRASNEKKVVDLFAYITFGSSGAPTLSATKSKMIKSISRTSTGLYVLTLSDYYTRMLGVQGHFVVASGVPAAPFIFEVSFTSNSILTFQTNAASGTSGALQAADPGSGEILKLAISLSNSTAN